MSLYFEERAIYPWRLLATEVPTRDIPKKIEDILKMPNFALWSIESHNDLSNVHMIRNRQMGGMTQLVEGFRPYFSDPKKSGGCIVQEGKVLFCPTAIPLHENRDSFTMNHGDGKNFYTTFSFAQLIRILLDKGRTLHRAHFDFASSEPKIYEHMDPSLLDLPL